MRKAPVFLLAVLIILPNGLRAQAGAAPSEDDPSSYIGLTLAELMRRFGAPRAVYPVRGLEAWQDDVVFAYDRGDFYILSDRVWQVGLRAAGGVKAGDSWGEALLALGSKAGIRYNSDSIFQPLDGGSWPMALRYDFDRDGKVRMIFIYRADL
jgi:hypothetical protein